MYKTILAAIFSAILALYPASAGAPATGGDIPSLLDINYLPTEEVTVDLITNQKGQTDSQPIFTSSPKLDLTMPLAGPSVHINYTGPADAFHWQDINSGEYHIYGVENDKFIYHPRDTWFVYGLFGPIEATKYDWNIRYELWNGNHNGIDFAVASGTPILATSGGEVIFTGFSAGNTIVVKQNNFHITYSHLQNILVSVGESVAQGQIIGYSGNSGTINPHLHLQIDEYKDDGSRWGINPAQYLPELNLAIIPQTPSNQLSKEIQSFIW